MTAPIDAAWIHEILKRLQYGQARLEQRLTSLDDRMQGFDAQLANLTDSFAALVRGGMRRVRESHELRRRIEGIERRLDLAEPRC